MSDSSDTEDVSPSPPLPSMLKIIFAATNGVLGILLFCLQWAVIFELSKLPTTKPMDTDLTAIVGGIFLASFSYMLFFQKLRVGLIRYFATFSLLLAIILIGQHSHCIWAASLLMSVACSTGTQPSPTEFNNCGWLKERIVCDILIVLFGVITFGVNGYIFRLTIFKRRV